jgi:nucleotide-binding universal stress UspA family protein
VRHILLAVDDSMGARRAADFVDRFFSPGEVTVTALNVARMPVRVVPAGYAGLFAWPMRGVSGVGTRLAVGDRDLEEAADRAEVVAGAVTALQAPAADRIGVAFGEPVAVICKIAEDQDVDLIVVGSGDRGFLRRMLHRSVAKALVRKSPRAVLIVR